MANRYGCSPKDILAGIGPSIGPNDYEIGKDVQSAFIDAFTDDIGRLIRHENGKMYLDLWKANQIVLEQAGVTQIEIAGLSTAGDLTRWYSHRAEKGTTGRFGALLSLD
jgi:hypothetical protein